MKILMAYFQGISVSGGAEHILCDFSNELVEKGHEVSIVCFDKNGGIPFYPLDKSVKIINLYHQGDMKFPLFKIGREIIRLFGGNKAARRYNGKRRLNYIPYRYREVEKSLQPDIVIAYEYQSVNEIASSGSKVPLIAMFHNDPNMLFDEMQDYEKVGLNHASCIQVLTPNFIEKVKRLYPHILVECIPNIVRPNCRSVDLSHCHYRIINVARLQRDSKRQHILVEAFGILAKEFPDWTVDLYGEGHKVYKNELQRLIKKWGLEGRVTLKGTTRAINDEYLSSDIFAFPSAYEGFGLAMTEAMSAGLPVVAFASCPAVNEIVKDGVDGILCKDGVTEFAAGLRTLMEDQEKRIFFGANAKKAMEEYTPDKVWNSWDRLISRIVEGSRSVK